MHTGCLWSQTWVLCSLCISILFCHNVFSFGRGQFRTVMAAGSLENKSGVWWAFRKCCSGALWAEFLGCCRSVLCRWVKSVWVWEQKHMQCFWYKSATAREDQWVHCSFDLAEVITSWRNSLEQQSSSVWAFWRKRQYLCMPMTYVFPYVWERKTECQFDK